MSATTEQNKAVIRRFFDAWNSRQPEAFDDLITPDVVRHCEATPGVEARSLDQVKEFLRQDTTVFPDSVQTIKLLIAEGNLVAAWTTYEGTQQGPMGPFPASGRKAQFDFRGSVPHRRWKDRRVVGDLGQHDDTQGTRPPTEWLRRAGTSSRLESSLCHLGMARCGLGQVVAEFLI